MALLPPTVTTISKIYDHYVSRQKASPPRTHLGASEIGQECERKIWYGFRWVKENEFPGKILRLFDTGKLAESRLIADLSSVGVSVKPFDMKSGKQYRMELFNGHFGGSLDGLCQGVMEAPKAWHVLELKTHNDKSFQDLIKKGVEKSKPEHFIQMQTYMGMSHEIGLPEIGAVDRALYFAVNKNDDALYTERIKYDGEVYLRIKEKVKRIIFSDRPLPKISEKEDFYQCKWCNFAGICHAKKEISFEKANKNCRTCLFSTVAQDGRWHCSKWDKNLNVAEQKHGCEKHLYLPGLIPFIQIDATDNSVEYDGVVNFEGGEIKTI